ncbi:Kinase-like protein [Mycena sanguinolenta]|uniref:Kinase-like protein n=1 Tax=Mycena sanguinolenta TaxID=230812 RepID=A0A8H7CMQ9_9AGAR|nr:Kinase-like protein [Mycena sanguinolenta]
MSTRILMYEALISYLQDACSAGISERSPSQVAQLHATLDGYLLSMAAGDVVSGIVESVERLKTLLELSGDLGLTSDSKLRMALRKDEERIATFLVSIFASKSLENDVLRLEGDSAQCFLDVVQNTLDKGFLLAQKDGRMARRIIRKLVCSSDKLPSALFITGITGKEDHPTFGGGFADIYRASYDDRVVALKYMRVVQYMRGSDLRDVRLKFCREALVWKELCHPHILPFLGIEGNSFPSPLCMVSPWMKHGTVLNHLKEHGHRDVDKLLTRLVSFTRSHKAYNTFIRGISSMAIYVEWANILINEDWSACLADFGLSIFSDATSLMTTNRGGSVYWMAPELLDPERFGMRFARTRASDVYALGCVCLELYTGRPPFSGVLSEPGAMMKVINGERPPRPSSSPAMSDVLWNHVSTYWAQEPTTRPATQLVVQNMVWPPPPAATEIPNLALASASRPGSPVVAERSSTSTVDWTAVSSLTDNSTSAGLVYDQSINTPRRMGNAFAGLVTDQSINTQGMGKGRAKRRAGKGTVDRPVRPTAPGGSIQPFRSETPVGAGASPRFSPSLARPSARQNSDEEDWETPTDAMASPSLARRSSPPNVPNSDEEDWETPTGATASPLAGPPDRPFSGSARPNSDEEDWETSTGATASSSLATRSAPPNSDEEDFSGSTRPNSDEEDWETPTGATASPSLARRSAPPNSDEDFSGSTRPNSDEEDWETQTRATASPRARRSARPKKEDWQTSTAATFLRALTRRFLTPKDQD